MLGVSYVMTFYVDACAIAQLCTFSFIHGRSVGWSVDPGTTSRHFGAETKITYQVEKKTKSGNVM